MKKYFPCINPPSEARSAAYEARSRSKELRFAVGTVAANTASVFYMAYAFAGAVGGHGSVELTALVALFSAPILAYHGWLLFCLRRSVQARQIVRAVDSGKPCDPKVADALTIVGISLVTAVERYDAMVKRWKAYEDAVSDEFDNMVDRLSDEDAIRDAIVSAGEDLAKYAKSVERMYRRRSVLKELSASIGTDTPLSFPEALDNLRLADARLRDLFVLRDDAPAVDSERLLAEPLLMAKLDALEKDMARIPAPAQPTNG